MPIYEPDSLLPLKEYEESINLLIINTLKNHPNVWNMDTVGYRLTNQREEGIEKLLNDLRQFIQTELNKDILQSIIVDIRTAASYEKWLKIFFTNRYKSRYKFAEEMVFLEPFVGPYKCEICGDILKKTTTYDTFKFHLSKHTGLPMFECFICKKRQKDKGNFIVHLRRHVKDFPFKCNYCEYRGPCTSDIKGHMTTHTGERKYFCEICGKTFRVSSHFTLHKRKHEGEKPFSCTICPKKFLANFHLTQHMKTHLNIKDIICSICGKGFHKRKLLRQHMFIHNKDKKFCCMICDKKFAQKAGLCCHMKSHEKSADYTWNSDEEEEEEIVDEMDETEETEMDTDLGDD